MKLTGHWIWELKYPIPWSDRWCWIVFVSRLQNQKQQNQRLVTIWKLSNLQNKLLNWEQLKSSWDLLRLWLSFFCLSFAMALTSASGQNQCFKIWQCGRNVSCFHSVRGRNHTYPQGTLQAFDSFQICHRIRTYPAYAWWPGIVKLSKRGNIFSINVCRMWTCT